MDETWGFAPQLVACEHCGWGFLLAQAGTDRLCPHCFHTALSPLPPAPETDELTSLTPELALPFTLSRQALAELVESFARSIPYPPADLNPTSLLTRLRRLYLPAWLVDVAVRANWQAEAGFDYEVVSHQERYSDAHGGWQTRQVKERRVRWEPRLGTLERTYANLPLPALDGDVHLKRILTGFFARLGQPSPSADPYHPELLTVGESEAPLVRLPGRNPQDAWLDALPKLQTAAAEECRLACKADHLRDFHWSPQVLNQRWTLLLLPLYSSYYLDDDGIPQPVYLHGQSGEIGGARRASPRRAQRAAYGLLIAAGVIFLLSLILGLSGMALPALLPIGGFALIIAIVLAACAVIPPLRVKRFNRAQLAQQPPTS